MASQDERIARLTAQLSGGAARTAAGAKVDRRLRLSENSGFLYGHMLRAAAKTGAGLELTDLESSLVGLLRVADMSDGQIAEVGAVYTDAVAAKTTAGLLPQAVTSTPLEQAYSFEDLARDLPAMAEEITALPNYRLVDLAELGEGAGDQVDSEEAAAARVEYGGGAIAVVCRREGRAAPPVDAIIPAPVRVEYQRFHAIRVGDVVLAPSAEIYWSSGAGTDQGEQSFKSREYGGVDSGETHSFDSGSNLFDGQIKHSFTAGMQCWEADQSDDQFYDDLRGSMNDIARWCFGASEKLIDQNEDIEGSSAFLSLVGLIATLIGAILGWLKNEDDLFGEVEIAYTATALHELSTRNEQPRLHFTDGGNKVDLYLKVVMPNLPAIDPSYVVWRKLFRLFPSFPPLWGDRMYPGWQAACTPTLGTSLSGQHVFRNAAFRDRDNRVNVAESYSDSGFYGGRRVRGEPRSSTDPVVAVHENAVLACFTNAEDGLFHMVSTFGDTVTLDYKGPAPTGPYTLVSHGGALWLISVDSDGSLATQCGRSAPGPSGLKEWLWTDGPRIPARATGRPAGLSYNGNLLIAYRGTDNDIYIAHENGMGVKVIEGRNFTSGPAITNHANKITLVMRDAAGNLVWSASDGTTTDAWPVYTIPDSACVGEPSAISVNNVLHVMYMPRY
ncbi:hypothetical protein [Yinghuangia seranimata]|uniref:hypothetical protein n=1 Tax=Yinghuangia seranimata TaxID=408067 RepID=UPI00248BF3AA|nr:hypothetical protein [Yinghuangia seranimata]MDI2130538.1 hypothetical protein [Yinghuangia seranimata]